MKATGTTQQDANKGKKTENILVLLTKGMKGYEIANELGVDASTVSRDIQYLISQSHNYLNSLAEEALPFMYQTSIEGIRNVLKECWTIYTIESNKEITWFLVTLPLNKTQEWISQKDNVKILFAYQPERPIIDTFTNLDYTIVMSRLYSCESCSFLLKCI